jgi:hypothetical protein
MSSMIGGRKPSSSEATACWITPDYGTRKQANHSILSIVVRAMEIQRCCVKSQDKVSEIDHRVHWECYSQAFAHRPARRMQVCMRSWSTPQAEETALVQAAALCGYNLLSFEKTNKTPDVPVG